MTNEVSHRDMSAYYAYGEGVECARNLTLDSVFKGAYGHATDNHMMRDSLDYSMFVAGFMAALPGYIITDRATHKLVHYSAEVPGWQQVEV